MTLPNESDADRRYVRERLAAAERSNRLATIFLVLAGVCFAVAAVAQVIALVVGS